MRKGFLFFTSLLLCKSLAKSNEMPVIPSLFVFGDSLLDNGNNNFLLTLARANFPPYGVNFIAGPTGRFTNGKTVADFTAELLGLPFSPPYMSLLSFDNFTGANYASGASGILPESGSNLGKCLPFDQQIDLFERTVVRDLQQRLGSTKDLDGYLSKAIFMVAVGTNDYINNYLQPLFFNTSQTYTPQAFAQFLIQRLTQQLERLYKLGARKIVTFEIGPIGCMPTYTNRLKPKTRCVENYNQLVLQFNTLISAMLKRQSSLLSGSLFLNGKIWELMNDMIENPSNYGLINTKDPCCIAVNGTLGCTPGLPACLNSDQYLWWDGYHLTQAAYSIITRDCFNGSSTCSSTSINQLVQA